MIKSIKYLWFPKCTLGENKDDFEAEIASDIEDWAVRLKPQGSKGEGDR